MEGWEGLSDRTRWSRPQRLVSEEWIVALSETSLIPRNQLNR